MGDSDLTPEERAAIRSLQRLAKKWPRSLLLIQHGDSARLKVARRTGDDRLDGDPANLPGVDSITLAIECCA